jgi:hypothetical protein
VTGAAAFRIDAAIAMVPRDKSARGRPVWTRSVRELSGYASPSPGPVRARLALVRASTATHGLVKT